MTVAEFFDKVKEFFGLLKIILPLLGLGGAGKSMYKGCNRVFEGYASANHIINFNITTFDSGMLSSWGSEVVQQPATLLATTPVQGIFFVFGLIVVAYLLLHHLLYVIDTKPEKTDKNAFYQKHHGKITLVIYAVLLALIVFPTHVLVFFFTLMVFILYFSAHLYFHFPIFRHGEADEKITYIIPVFLIVIVALFVPTVYGGSYFTPTVWHSDIEVEQNKVWIANEGAPIRIFFADPTVPGTINVGNLTKAKDKDKAWSLTVDTANRTIFKSVRSGEKSKSYTPVELTKLLNMQTHVRNTESTILDITAGERRINEQLGTGTQPAVDTTYGYPLPR